ncbi:protein kinase [Ideonella sp.]|uniref:serine/threonine-protein kinase n=1 Tax=Ideonella sp. TaxID=1929293 RepID=UPI0035ADF946
MRRLPPGHLARLSARLDEALALPPADRAAWLAALPADDAALREELATLLAEADDAPGPRAAPPARGGPATVIDVLDALPALAQAAASERLGSTPPAADTEPLRQVGPWCLLRPLGQGGMGTVWLAERHEGDWQRNVALKLPHPGALVPGLAHRFARERDILAALEHPHIARLYDAGVTDDGQPWLAMEWVEGAPITQWCDARQLPLRERIVLFLQVLQAVQYAHSRLVVHRDLKPSNILVGDDGRVRLLDFGIATLLDDADAPDAGARTEWAHAPLTPDYASPEQIARAPHQPIGTASDIYSLGVLLYELCTGQRPYRLPRDTRGALEDAILTTQPARPSRLAPQAQAAAHRATRPAGLRRQLRGDLDNIVLMALRKQPAERYASAEAFEQDLRRWLQHEPVQAHPPGTWYHLTKFVRRHTAAVAAGGLAAASLVAGLAVALDQAERARREAQRSQAVQAFLVGLFNEVDPAKAQGREPTVRDLMARGERDLQARLADEPALHATLGGLLVQLYLKLGDGRRALPLAEARLALVTREHGEGGPEQAAALIDLARTQTSLGRHEASLATLARARPAIERAASERPVPWLELQVAMADNLMELTRYDEGRATLQAALPGLARQHGPGSFEVASVRSKIATSLAIQGRHAEARVALSELEPLLSQDWRAHGMGSASMRSDIGFAQWQLRRFPAAADSLQRAVAELDHLAGRHNSLSIQSQRTLGMVHLDAGHYEMAHRVFADNVERSRAVYGAEDGETALNLSFHVMALMRTGRLPQAEQAARDSVRLATREGAALSASELRGLRRRLGSALLLAGRAAEAVTVLEAVRAEEVAAGQQDTRHAATLMLHAAALAAAGRAAEGVRAAEASAALWRERGGSLGPAGQIGLARARLNGALARLAAGDTAQAEPWIEEAQALLRAAHGDAAHPDRELARLVRAQWLQAAGQPQAAAALAREARAAYRRQAGADAPERIRLVH